MTNNQTNWIAATTYLAAVGNLYNQIAAIVGLTHTIDALADCECVNWHGAANAIDHARINLRDDLQRIASASDLYGVANLLMFCADLAKRNANNE